MNRVVSVAVVGILLIVLLALGVPAAHSGWSRALPSVTCVVILVPVGRLIILRTVAKSEIATDGQRPRLSPPVRPSCVSVRHLRSRAERWLRQRRH